MRRSGGGGDVVARTVCFLLAVLFKRWKTKLGALVCLALVRTRCLIDANVIRYETMHEHNSIAFPRREQSRVIASRRARTVQTISRDREGRDSNSIVARDEMY